MFEFISYQNTPAGKIQLQSDCGGRELVDILAVVAGDAGLYEVQAQGIKPALESSLYLPIKGARLVSLKLRVIGVTELISPVGAWKATCRGPDVKEFNLRCLDMSCDECNEISQLEFIEYSDSIELDAIKALNQQGWLASLERQVCPKCCKAAH
ncbi:MAG: hypothetical protein V7785_06385 [Bermanella sp.]